jgi:hypothetical protein
MDDHELEEISFPHEIFYENAKSMLALDEIYQNGVCSHFLVALPKESAI